MERTEQSEQVGEQVGAAKRTPLPRAQAQNDRQKFGDARSGKADESRDTQRGDDVKRRQP